MEDKKLASDLMESLNAHRRDGKLCDVQLNIKDKQFHAHRAVLAAISPYFESMFSGGFKEQTEASINLDETPVSAENLKVLLDAVYTGTLRITTDNVMDVHGSADFFQMTRFQPLCRKFIENNLSAENCCDYLKVASKWQLKDLQQEIQDKAAKQYFLAVCHTTKFRTLDLDNVLAIVASDELLTQKQEIEVFRALCGWFEENETPRERMDAVLTDATYIDYRHITPKMMTEEVIPHRLMQSGKIQSYLSEMLDAYHHQPAKQPKLYKGHRGAFCRAYLDQHDNLIFSSPDLEYQSIVKIELPEEFSGRVKVHKIIRCSYAFVFVFGEIRDNRIAHFIQRYNIPMGIWDKFEMLPVKATTSVYRTDILGISGAIYFVSHGFTVSIYDVERSEWKFTEEIPIDTSSDSCVDSNGVVYVLGLSKRAVSTFFACNITTRDLSWRQLAAPSKDPGGICTFIPVSSERLYRFWFNDAGISRFCLSEYSTADDRWTSIELPENKMVMFRKFFRYTNRYRNDGFFFNEEIIFHNINYETRVRDEIALTINPDQKVVQLYEGSDVRKLLLSRFGAESLPLFGLVRVPR